MACDSVHFKFCDSHHEIKVGCEDFGTNNFRYHFYLRDQLVTKHKLYQMPAEYVADWNVWLVFAYAFGMHTIPQVPRNCCCYVFFVFVVSAFY